MTLQFGSFFKAGLLFLTLSYAGQAAAAQSQTSSQEKIAQQKQVDPLAFSRRIQDHSIQLCFNKDFGLQQYDQRIEKMLAERLAANMKKVAREAGKPAKTFTTVEGKNFSFKYDKAKALREVDELRLQLHRAKGQQIGAYNRACHSRFFLQASVANACQKAPIKYGDIIVDYSKSRLCRDLTAYEAEQSTHHQFVESFDQIEGLRNFGPWVSQGFQDSPRHEGYSMSASTRVGNFRYKARIVSKVRGDGGTVAGNLNKDLWASAKTLGYGQAHDKALLPVLEFSFDGVSPNKIFPGVYMTTVSVVNAEGTREVLGATSGLKKYTVALEQLTDTWGKAPSSGPFPGMTKRENFAQVYMGAIVGRAPKSAGSWHFLMSNRLLSAMKTGKLLIFSVVYFDKKRGMPNEHNFLFSLDGFARNVDLYKRFFKGQPVRRAQMISDDKNRKSAAITAKVKVEHDDLAKVRGLMARYVVKPGTCGAMPPVPSISASDSRVTREIDTAESWLDCLREQNRSVSTVWNNFIKKINLDQLYRHNSTRPILDAYASAFEASSREIVAEATTLVRKLENRDRRMQRRNEKRWRAYYKAEARQRRDKWRQFSRDLQRAFNTSMNSNWAYRSSGFN